MWLKNERVCACVYVRAHLKKKIRLGDCTLIQVVFTSPHHWFAASILWHLQLCLNLDSDWSAGKRNYARDNKLLEAEDCPWKQRSPGTSALGSNCPELPDSHLPQNGNKIILSPRRQVRSDPVPNPGRGNWCAFIWKRTSMEKLQEQTQNKYWAHTCCEIPSLWLYALTVI